MNCPDCGSTMRGKLEPHRYSVTPEWSVSLEKIEVRRCPKCGYYDVTIDRPEALHRAIASAVVRKPSRLAGPEVTFLRRQLGHSGKELARTLGVRAESVSRWERGRERIGPTADRLLRALVALAVAGREKFPVEVFADIAEGSGPLKLVVAMNRKSGEWAWSQAA